MNINEHIKKLDRQIYGGIDFVGFLNDIDLFQQNSLPELLKSGFVSPIAEAIIVKFSNFLVGKYQYVNRHHYLLARPYSLIVDPSNSCPLSCPGCLHNTLFKRKIDADWPGGNLSNDLFLKFITEFGPHASTVLFYNWGEPLLNKNTPNFIKKAKSYMLHTSLSSNLSIDFDADELVLSGLDYMILSVDGVTANSYERYRRGGHFDLVIENIKKIVNAKNKHKISTPVLSWQFLVFEHNKHEIEKVKLMANELGVNDVKFSNPYDVIWEPDIIPAGGKQTEIYTVGYDCKDNYGCCDVNISGEFSNIFQKKWTDKLPKDEQSFAKRHGRSCKWLYTSITMDAHGRYLPCCYAPRNNSGFTYVFATANPYGGNEDPFNSSYYQFSRKHFTWFDALKTPEGTAPRLTVGPATYCVACPDRSTPPLVNEKHLKRYVKQLDPVGLLDQESLDVISSWD